MFEEAIIESIRPNFLLIKTEQIYNEIKNLKQNK